MKNILIVTYWSFNDPLIQTYTLPYVRIIRKNLPEGSRIYLFVLNQKAYDLPAEEYKRRKELLEKENIFLVDAAYRPFGFGAMARAAAYIFRMWRLCKRHRISYIHAWCTPGGAIGYLLSRMTGIPLVVDSYEPHAEPMVEGGTWGRKSLAYRILFRMERKQAERAIAVIGLTAGMKDYAFEKFGVKLQNYFVKPACVDFSVFDHRKPSDERLRESLGLKDKIVCVYAGKLSGIYLLQEVFDLFKAARDHWGDRFRVLFLTKESEQSIQKLAAKSGVPGEVIVTRFVDHREISNYMRLASFGLNPVKPIPSRRHCTSIKDGEYWAMGLPVMITPGISDDSDIIAQNKIGSVISELSYKGYLKCVQEMDELLKSTDRDALAEKVSAIGKKYRSFDNAEMIYKKIYGG